MKSLFKILCFILLFSLLSSYFSGNLSAQIENENYLLNEKNSATNQYCGKCFLTDNTYSSTIIQSMPSIIEKLNYWNLFLSPKKTNLCNSMNEYSKEYPLSNLILCENIPQNYILSNNVISFNNAKFFNFDSIESLNLVKNWLVDLNKNKNQFLISCSNFHLPYFDAKPAIDNRICVFLKDTVEKETIIQALSKGASYITFTPLLTFSINNSFPGEMYKAEDYIKIQFSVFFDSEETLENFKNYNGNWIRAEITKDSNVIRTFPIKLNNISFSREFDFFDLNLKGTYVLKIISNDGNKLIALTNPIFVR